MSDLNLKAIGNLGYILPSDMVSVFPCGRRGFSIPTITDGDVLAAINEKAAKLDPESRISTEYNNTLKSAIGAYTNTFLESWDPTGDVKFVIKGYNFKLHLETTLTKFIEESLKVTSAQQGDTLYALIKTENAAISVASNGTDAINTRVLARLAANETDFLLDSIIVDDSENVTTDGLHYYFYGLSFLVSTEQNLTSLIDSNYHYLALADYDSIGEWSLIRGGVMSANIERVNDGSNNHYRLNLITNQRSRPNVYYPETIANGYKYINLNSADSTAILAGFSSGNGAGTATTIPEEVIFGETTYDVIGIASYAFAGTDIIKLEIPESYIYIGERAFMNCHKLETIKIPENIQIDSEAFLNCSHLTTVETYRPDTV